jgi:hypothetical protein
VVAGFWVKGVIFFDDLSVQENVFCGDYVILALAMMHIRDDVLHAYSPGHYID